MAFPRCGERCHCITHPSHRAEEDQLTINKLYKLLDQLNLAIRQGTEQAEPEIEKPNMQLGLLFASGLLPRTSVYGPAILTRPYGDVGPSDTGEVVHAVLGMPGGFGALYLDSEEDGPEVADRGEYAARIVPFGGCELAVRTLLLPHALPLLDRMLSSVRVQPDAKRKLTSQRPAGANQDTNGLSNPEFLGKSTNVEPK